MKRTCLILFGLLLTAAILFEVPVSPLPIASTRYAIETAEKVQSKISPFKAPTELRHAILDAMVESDAFKGGYVKLTDTGNAGILDAWGTPLAMMTKNELARIPNVASNLIAKTNLVIVWSAGENRINEFGSGDDVFLKVGGR